LPLGARAADWPQWRGPQRNGISAETGLLAEWPKEGPKLVWQVKDIDSGYSTPAVVGDRLYLLSNEGMDNEFMQALDAKDGKRVWSQRIGKVGNPDQQPNYPAARSTPTVDGEWVYAFGSDGDLACLERATGKVRWQKNVRKDYGGQPGTWAYSESPLVDGEAVLCTPGGPDATLVALNKNTGELIWKCAVPGGEQAAYTSALVIEAGGVRQCIQMLQKGLRDMKLQCLPLKYGQFITKPCVSPQRFYGSRRRTRCVLGSEAFRTMEQTWESQSGGALESDDMVKTK
jgi:glucose dehydrogenase